MFLMTSIEMDKVCVSCLSQNRKLFVIKPKYWNVFRWIVKKQMNPNLRICWECAAHVRRFYLFIERTQENARILENSIDLKELKCQSGLSTVTFANTSEIDASVAVKNDNEPHIKIEYDDESQDCFKTDLIPANNLTLDDVTKDEHFDCEHIFKLENESVDCSSEIETNIHLEEEGSGTNNVVDMPTVKQTKPPGSEHVDMWTVDMVSEEQMREWRREDENTEKYQRLFLKCTTCLIAFNYKYQLYTHNSKHHHEALGGHICDICKSRFRTEILMKEHRKQHFMLYKCLICPFTSREFNIFYTHVIREHTEASFKCNQCDAVFKTRCQLQYHKTKHKANHKCQYCDKVFKMKSYVYLHIAKKHTNLSEQICHICNKVLKDKYALTTHMRNVHFEAKYKHYCIECDVHFKTANIYKQHLAKSAKHLKSEDLKYECEECGRRFVSEKLKKAHHERIHLKKGLFVCDKCPKSYCTRRGLRLHKAQKHDSSYARPPRDKVCDACGKAFSSKPILTAHIRTHTGERPYKCKQCPSTFTQSGALYTHTKLVHHKQKRKIHKKKGEIV